MAKKKNYHYVLVCTSEGPVFVTSLGENRYAHFDKKEKPFEISEYRANDVAFGLSANFYCAYHIKSEFEITSQPYRYDAGHFEWAWDNENNEDKTE